MLSDNNRQNRCHIIGVHLNQENNLVLECVNGECARRVLSIVNGLFRMSIIAAEKRTPGFSALREESHPTHVVIAGNQQEASVNLLTADTLFLKEAYQDLKNYTSLGDDQNNGVVISHRNL